VGWRATTMTTLNPRAAFLHVINDHRWLAASGWAWNLVGPSAANGTKNEIHKRLPNIDVMILDSLLLHARSLIDFYTKDRTKHQTKRQAIATDILLCDFRVSIDQARRQRLENHRKPIEVHLLHLTDWRDLDYRNRNATGNDANKDRLDWDKEVTPIVDSIFEALKCVSEQTSDWQQPFRDLYNASTERYRNEEFVWPPYLGEKSDVEAYLTNLGL
jgi:hypothetical protein